MDATCNNRRNKNWGRAGTAFQRILGADYDDGEIQKLDNVELGCLYVQTNLVIE